MEQLNILIYKFIRHIGKMNEDWGRESRCPLTVMSVNLKPEGWYLVNFILGSAKKTFIITNDGHVFLADADNIDDGIELFDIETYNRDDPYQTKKLELLVPIAEALQNFGDMCGFKSNLDIFKPVYGKLAMEDIFDIVPSLSEFDM